MEQSFLTVKLYEMERQYGKMQARIRLCQKEDTKALRKELKEIQAECEEEDLLLRQSVDTARSRGVAALSEAQLVYDKQISEIWEKVLPDSVHGRDTWQEEKAEAGMLYAEYSIDFALRAAKNALYAALAAIAAERECEEWRKDDE